MEDEQFFLSDRHSCVYEARAGNLMRAALQRELESEMRGLIMAARLHGFRLAIEGETMDYRAIDTGMR